MTPDDDSRQLEFFDLSGQAAPRRSRVSIGRLSVHLRYDQLVLAGMAAVIGLTVVFASGVERGKQLVRSERSMLASRASRPSDVPAPVATMPALPLDQPPAIAPWLPAAKVIARQAPAPTEPARTVPATSKGKKTETDSKSIPANTPSVGVKKSQTRVVSAPVSGRSRYAIQVMTYSRPQLAQRELARLHARGERAFLIIQEGHTIVYVGPFPSKGNASEKLGTLKTRYQDCFLRTL